MYNNYPAVILMFAIFELRDQRRRLVSRGDTCYQNYILAKKNVNAACPKCHNENVIENRIYILNFLLLN